MRCRNPKCYDGKVPVNHGEALAPCPECSSSALPTGSAAIDLGLNQKLKSRMIQMAAQMAMRQNMPSPEEWPGWGARTPQKLWRAAKKECDKADAQCADWAYELRKIADAL